jgi:hypothetical protein
MALTAALVVTDESVPAVSTRSRTVAASATSGHGTGVASGAARQ